jgi:hypothetical protein
VGQQRRFGDVRDMSALALNSGHKSASQQADAKCQEATYAPQQTNSLFDHLISASEQCRGQFQTDCFRRDQVDD